MHSLNGNSNSNSNSSSINSNNNILNTQEVTTAESIENGDTSEIIETLSTYSNNNNNNNHHSILKNTNDLLKCHNSNSNGHLQKQFTNGQKDILRLIGQHLRQLGLTKTTEQLINESGCMLEHPVATNFSNLILNGDWDKAERSLIELKSIIDLNTDIIVSK
jgi:WD repeat-containing protein 26